MAIPMMLDMAKDQQKLFSLRTDNPEGQEFLEALDEIREAEAKPTPSRSDMVRRLVFERQALLRQKGKRQ